MMMTIASENLFRAEILTISAIVEDTANYWKPPFPVVSVGLNRCWKFGQQVIKVVDNFLHCCRFFFHFLCLLSICIGSWEFSPTQIAKTNTFSQIDENRCHKFSSDKECFLCCGMFHIFYLNALHFSCTSFLTKISFLNLFAIVLSFWRKNFTNYV